MSDLRFTKDHEWIRVDGDVGTVGISDYAQGQLGDVVFVELPPVGKHVKQGDDMAVVESVKAASEVYAPVSGTVVEVNDAIADNPAVVNQAAMAGGWFVKLRLDVEAKSGLDALMDEAAYRQFIEGLS